MCVLFSNKFKANQTEISFVFLLCCIHSKRIFAEKKKTLLKSHAVNKSFCILQSTESSTKNSSTRKEIHLYVNFVDFLNFLGQSRKKKFRFVLFGFVHSHLITLNSIVKQPQKKSKWMSAKRNEYYLTVQTVQVIFFCLFEMYFCCIWNRCLFFLLRCRLLMFRL